MAVEADFAIMTRRLVASLPFGMIQTRRLTCASSSVCSLCSTQVDYVCDSIKVVIHRLHTGDLFLVESPQSKDGLDVCKEKIYDRIAVRLIRYVAPLDNRLDATSLSLLNITRDSNRTRDLARLIRPHLHLHLPADRFSVPVTLPHVRHGRNPSLCPRPSQTTHRDPR